MEFLIDPNVAYVSLMLGSVLLLLAIVTPGSGLLEAGAFFCLILPAYVAYRNGLNWWALLILGLSLVPFIYAIRKPRRGLYLGLSILCLILGSLYLYPSQPWWVPAVNPFVAIIVSALAAGFLWITVNKTLKALQARPVHDMDALIGQIGEAKTRIYREGSVQVAGELWSARSEKEIPAGQTVRVVKREGFTLLVEKEESSRKSD